MTVKEKKDRTKFFLFISPWLIGFFLFTLIPMLMSLFYSFTDWDVLTPAKFVGFDNYVGLLEDELFFKSIQVTAVFTGITVPLNVFLSLLVAILLNMDGKVVGVFRTIYYMPSILSGVVVAVLWQWILNSKYGLLNDFLGHFGIEGPRWLSDSKWAMSAMVIMSVWTIGGNLLFYLAGLQAVPVSLYEAARLDGAGFFRRLFSVTLPSMSPIMLFAFLTSLIGTLQTFTQAYVMTDGGPDNSTLFYAYYVYKNGFEYKKMGKACAMAWLLMIVTFLLAILVIKVSDKVVYYESDEGGKLL